MTEPARATATASKTPRCRSRGGCEVDIAHTEMVEAELTRFIEKRHEKRVKTEGQRVEEELWMASARIYNNGKERERAVAWYCYEKRLERLHTALAAEHEAKAREWGLQVERMDKAEQNGHMREETA